MPRRLEWTKLGNSMLYAYLSIHVLHFWYMYASVFRPSIDCKVNLKPVLVLSSRFGPVVALGEVPPGATITYRALLRTGLQVHLAGVFQFSIGPVPGVIQLCTGRGFGKRQPCYLERRHLSVGRPCWNHFAVRTSGSPEYAN